ncbi:MAG: ribosome-associated translation inhibitor RaiA [Acidobacteriota bacterium]|nr:ribosome-associated translation inhibitor RaiA [Acidobacteriota bacterium]
MKVSYKGIKDEIPVKLQQKLDAKFAKLSKLVDGRGEKQAHVVVTSERHLHKAEITLHCHNQQLVGIASGSDVFSALCAALDRVEKQAAKQGARWRATTRRPEPAKASGVKAGAPAAVTKNNGRKTAHSSSKQPSSKQPNSEQRVFRPDHHERRKPITLEEAMLEMEDGRDYVAYRDADKQATSILIRRRDGHYDLIET